jgi:hypothetical protein
LICVIVIVTYAGLGSHRYPLYRRRAVRGALCPRGLRYCDMKDRKVLAREIAACTVLRFVKLSREGTARASSDFGKPAPGLFSINPCTHSSVGFDLAPFLCLREPANIPGERKHEARETV